MKTLKDKTKHTYLHKVSGLRRTGAISTLFWCPLDGINTAQGLFCLYIITCLPKFANGDYYLCHVSLSVRQSTWNNSAPTGQILTKRGIWASFFRKSVHNIQLPLKSDTIKGYFTRKLFTFMAILRWILLRMRNLSKKICIKNQNTHFIFSNFFPKIAPFMR